MKDRIKEILYRASACLLIASGLAKWHLLLKKKFLVGSFLGLDAVPLGYVLATVVAVELIIGVYIFRTRSAERAFLLLFLAGAFGAYRLVIHFFDISSSCSCLGAIPQLLGMGHGADNVLSYSVYGIFLGMALVLNWLEAKAANF